MFVGAAAHITPALAAPRLAASSIICCAADPEPDESKQAIGKIFGFLYLGNFIVVVTLGLINRFTDIRLPPINSLTDISNNAMDAEIAAGTLQPILATAWATNFWLDLIRQYFAAAQDPSFVADYCATHASLCAGVVF